MHRIHKLALITLVTSFAFTSGCAAHSHGHKHGHVQTVKTVRVLENEHNDRKIVVVNTKPAKSRKCWKHARHWHCKS